MQHSLVLSSTAFAPADAPNSKNWNTWTIKSAELLPANPPDRDSYKYDPETPERIGDLSVVSEKSMGLNIPIFIEGAPVPQPGDQIKILGGLGHPIRGAIFGNFVYYYKTQDEHNAENARWLKRYNDHNLKIAIDGAAKNHAIIQGLRAPFKKRMERLFYSDGSLNTQTWADCGGDYELFAVSEAQKIFDHCANAAEVQAFRNLPWEDQKGIVSDGHSGNTFGFACSFAERVHSGRNI